MKASRFIAEWLKGKGIENVFGVQGGAVVHLFDACERFGPKPIYHHHEQAAGFAAGAVARVRGFSCAIFTTGPGATNGITPVLGAWQNFTPLLVLSGQARIAQTSYGTTKRQVGLQEAPIVDAVRPFTKDAQWVHNASVLKTLLDESYLLCKENPCGPVWLDIPLDVQWQEI